MKKLPLGVQTFRYLIEEGFLYVDKTRHIHDLFAGSGKYFFLSRPRRFGKSLLISTLFEIFSGNKELFKDLWIYDKIPWTRYPVIHLDLSKLSFKTPEMLEEALDLRVEQIAVDYGIKLDSKLFLKEKFGKLLEKMSQKQKVVILIDEYDKPIIHHMEADAIETATKIRDVLKDFYAVMKGSDAHLRFVFLTGVSKFSKVSVFSDLNNLRDITLSRQFASLLGYTESELKTYFEPFFNPLAVEVNVDPESIVDTIREWYNGYSWDGENFVYNPFSILNLFTENRFKNFWFTTGTPGFLINSIKKQQSEIMQFDNLPVTGYTFDSFDVENLEIPSLLFQTGYLTIKKITVKKLEETYHLSYPNKEVRDSFLTHLFGAYVQQKMTFSTRLLERVNDALEADDMDAFVREMRSLFASIPYNIFIGRLEAYYHTIIYLILKLTGASVKVEDPTNIGRIDAVVEARKKIYIMEFKIGSADDALAQIKRMKYYQKYLGKGKKVVLMGVGFNPEKRNIADYLLENSGT